MFSKVKDTALWVVDVVFYGLALACSPDDIDEPDGSFDEARAHVHH